MVKVWKLGCAQIVAPGQLQQYATQTPTENADSQTMRHVCTQSCRTDHVCESTATIHRHYLVCVLNVPVLPEEMAVELLAERSRIKAAKKLILEGDMFIHG